MGRKRLHPPGQRTWLQGIIRPTGSPRITGTRNLGLLLTPCWCQQYHDYIPAHQVARGQTWSCGPNCQPPPKDIA